MIIAKQSNAKTVVVVDLPPIAYAVQQLLQGEEGLQFGGAFARSVAYEEIAKVSPALIVADIFYTDGSPTDFIRNLCEIVPSARILVWSAGEDVWGARALRVGAKGFLSKHSPMSELVIAMRQVLSGLAYASNSVKDYLVRRACDGAGNVYSQLSEREAEVFHYLGSGKSTRQVAHTLRLSVKTVESHRAHIKKKLGLRNATELLTAAIQWRSNGST